MITSIRIPEDRRVQHTAGIFGIHYSLYVEPTVYLFADRLSPEYRGGYWHFYALSSGGFYMAPDDDILFPVVCENGFRGNLSADALGITACLYTYSHLSFSGNHNLAELCARQFHLLREYTMDHEEVRAVLAAID